MGMSAGLFLLFTVKVDMEDSNGESGTRYSDSHEAIPSHIP